MRKGQRDGRRTRRRIAENLLLGHVQEKVMMVEKISPKDWMETGASWKGHSKLQSPKRRGIILEPEQDKEDPSAVRSLTLEVEEETGARKN